MVIEVQGGGGQNTQALMMLMMELLKQRRGEAKEERETSMRSRMLRLQEGKAFGLEGQELRNYVEGITELPADIGKKEEEGLTAKEKIEKYGELDPRAPIYAKEGEDWLDKFGRILHPVDELKRRRLIDKYRGVSDPDEFRMDTLRKWTERLETDPELRNLTPQQKRKWMKDQFRSMAGTNIPKAIGTEAWKGLGQTIGIKDPMELEPMKEFPARAEGIGAGKEMSIAQLLSQFTGGQQMTRPGLGIGTEETGGAGAMSAIMAQLLSRLGPQAQGGTQTSILDRIAEDILAGQRGMDVQMFPPGTI